MKREVKIIVHRPRPVIKRQTAKLDIKATAKLKARQIAMAVFGD